MSLDQSLRDELCRLAEAGLLREPATVAGSQGPTVRLGGRDVLCFCSNNYLGFADDARLAQAAAKALQEHGLGSGASRLVSGSMPAHLAAEQALAGFVGLPASLLFATGYAANTGTLPALCGVEDAIFSDRLNHASLIDGCRLSAASVHVYEHADASHLEALLAEHRDRHRRALIVTDAVFSMDGDLAPLRALRPLADKYDAALMVDEAHALGVLGPQGRGLCAELGVRAEVVVGTLGKAFGCAGAFVAGSETLVQVLNNRARSYVFSTAPPPAIAAAATRAAGLVLEADDRRRTLLHHATRLREGLRDAGFSVPRGRTPIIPVMLGDPRRTMQASAELLQRGIFVQGIRPPSVPDGKSRLRLVPMATHSHADVDAALEAFRSLPWR